MDPLQARKLPLSWIDAMVEWMVHFEHHAESDLSPLVIQGEHDATVDWKYNLSVLNQKFNPRVLRIEGARHHLVNEAEDIRKQIFDYLDQFISIARDAS